MLTITCLALLKKEIMIFSSISPTRIFCLSYLLHSKMLPLQSQQTFFALIYSHYEYLLAIYCMPLTSLNSRNIAVIKTHEFLLLRKLHLSGKTDNRHM